MARNEKQKITLGSVATPKAGAGQIKLTLPGYGTTGDIDVDYLDTNVQSALEGLLGANTIATFTFASNVWVEVEFNGTAGNHNFQQMTWEAGTNGFTIVADSQSIEVTQQGQSAVQTQEVQEINFSVVPDSGTWAINNSGLLNYNCSTSDVQNAIGNCSVSNTMTGGFQITYNSYGNQPEPTITSNSLTNTSNPVDITVSTTTQGVDTPGQTHKVNLTLSSSPTGGTWYLSIDGVEAGPYSYDVDGNTLQYQFGGWSVSKNGYTYSFESQDYTNHTITANTSGLTAAGTLEITTTQQGQGDITLVQRKTTGFRIGSRNVFN